MHCQTAVQKVFPAQREGLFNYAKSFLLVLLCNKVYQVFGYSHSSRLLDSQGITLVATGLFWWS